MSTKGRYNRRANVKLYSVVQFCFIKIDTQNSSFLLKWFLDIIVRFRDAEIARCSGNASFDVFCTYIDPRVWLYRSGRTRIL